MRFVVYHAAFERETTERAYDPDRAATGVNSMVKVMDDHGIPPNGNVYAELGTTWRETMRELHRGQPPAPIEQPSWIASAGDDAFRRTRDVIVDSGGELLQSLFRDLADLLSDSAREQGVDVRIEWPERSRFDSGN